MGRVQLHLRDMSTPEQIEALIRYIEEHQEEVLAVHRRIEERNARGNPAWVEEKLKRFPWHARIQAHAKEIRRRRQV